MYRYIFFYDKIQAFSCLDAGDFVVKTGSLHKAATAAASKCRHNHFQTNKKNRQIITMSSSLSFTANISTSGSITTTTKSARSRSQSRVIAFGGSGPEIPVEEIRKIQQARAVAKAKALADAKAKVAQPKNRAAVASSSSSAAAAAKKPAFGFPSFAAKKPVISAAAAKKPVVFAAKKPVVSAAKKPVAAEKKKTFFGLF